MRLSLCKAMPAGGHHLIHIYIYIYIVIIIITIDTITIVVIIIIISSSSSSSSNSIITIICIIAIITHAHDFDWTRVLLVAKLSGPPRLRRRLHRRGQGAPAAARGGGVNMLNMFTMISSNGIIGVAVVAAVAVAEAKGGGFAGSGFAGSGGSARETPRVRRTRPHVMLGQRILWYVTAYYE